MNSIDFHLNRSVNLHSLHTNSPGNCTLLYITMVIIIMIKSSIFQFRILKNHGEMFGENRITFDPSLHIKSPLEIRVCIYKWFKNFGIVMKFSMKVYFVILLKIIILLWLCCSHLFLQCCMQIFVYLFTIRFMLVIVVILNCTIICKQVCLLHCFVVVELYL